MEAPVRRSGFAASRRRAPVVLPPSAGLGDALANTAIALRRRPETLIYHLSFGRVPDYVNPVTYTEKVQWRKLFDRNPDLVTFCDKLASKDFVHRRDTAAQLPELLWEGTDAGQMPLDSLEPPYVIKANNRSNAVIFVESASHLDEDDIRETCARWLEAPPHRRRIYEWAYGKVESKIFVERLLYRPDEKLGAPDLKMLVFHGRAQYLYWRDPYNTLSAIHDVDWRRYEWDRWTRTREVSRTHLEATPPRPRALDAAIEAAELIAADIDHLRVDLYEIDGTVYFGELTVYPSSGHKIYVDHDAVFDDPPDNIDREMGSHWHLSPLSKKTMLRRGLIG